MRRAAIGIVAAALVVAAVVAGEVAGRTKWAGTAVETSFYSKGVRGRVHLSVYLPPGYATSTDADCGLPVPAGTPVEVLRVGVVVASALRRDQDRRLADGVERGLPWRK